ncbi:MAG: hypothetical protein R2711_15515 [Acidimicrobiales bacterium]
MAPDAALDVRSAAAAETLRRVAPGIEAAALAVAGPLDRAVADAAAIGRPLFAANRDVARPDDPVAALWQRCTTLREHRGDGHVAVLAAAGLSGLEAHVLIAAERGSDPVDLQRTRGWTEDDWAGAVAGLAHRGLVDGNGACDPPAPSCATRWRRPPTASPPRPSPRGRTPTRARCSTRCIRWRRPSAPPGCCATRTRSGCPRWAAA